ncbi:MAG: TIGR04133 family radical SAM/SPASM protein [Prevotellaceae bacterium]|jgi:radical SAM enzyme (rSAM/lipoprotein system)|nr:TIGR04133 family radical SAM/SPASM protein [Prevotellaceae bacterium]
MSVDTLSFRKRLGLNLYRRFKNSMAAQHPLRYLFWECTLRCNLACRHCGSDCRKNMQHKDMPLSDFLKVIDNIRPHVDPHQTMVVLTGGEPLLRTDLEQCGMELYRREFPWGFVTNGFAVTQERIAQLMSAGLRAVTVSLDGLEDSHNRLRGNSLSFRNACNAIRIFIARGKELEFDVVTCACQNNFHELPAIKELLIGMGLKSWRIFTIFPIGRAAKHEDLQLQPVQLKQLFDFIKQTRREGCIRVDYGCEGFLGAYEAEVRDSFFFCRAGVTVGSVLVDGSISACPNLRSNFVQGNIYKDSFMDVWNSRYQVFRNRSWAKTGECARCKHFKFCQGNGMHLRNENGDLLLCHLNKIKRGEELLNA